MRLADASMQQAHQVLEEAGTPRSIVVDKSLTNFVFDKYGNIKAWFDPVFYRPPQGLQRPVVFPVP
jgi:hypothetical protein